MRRQNMINNIYSESDLSHDEIKITCKNRIKEKHRLFFIRYIVALAIFGTLFAVSKLQFEFKDKIINAIKIVISYDPLNDNADVYGEIPALQKDDDIEEE